MARTHQKPEPPTMCVYCAEREATERDHVPPKALFVGDLPSNMIRVPVCRPCNEAFGVLDEEFRVYLSVFAGMDSPRLHALWKEHALPTLAHNRRLLNKVRSELREVDAVTPGGVIIGKAGMVPWNKRRHAEFITRLTRGLYFHHYCEILNPKIPVTVDAPTELAPAIKEAIKLSKANSVGGRQFFYRYNRVPDAPELSFWFFVFQERHFAVAATWVDEEERQ